MTEWNPVVVRLNKIERHPEADTLEISTVHEGYVVIFKEGRFKEGDLAAYLPSDTICSNHPEFDWLGDKKRIKPIRLRGVFSLGILATPPEGMIEGDSVIEYYDLKKHVYEEEQPDVPGRMNGQHASPPEAWSIPYYDLESLRQHSWLLEEGEEVIITEKVEGHNVGYSHDGEKLWVKSRNYYLKPDDKNLYWMGAKQYNLEEKLAQYPGLVFFAEQYGKVKGFKYDCKVENGTLTPRLRFFDVYDTKSMRYLDWDEAEKIITSLGLDMVPVLYRGPWKGKEQWVLAEGESVLGGNVREGFVVQPVKDRLHPKYGRVKSKLKGEAYMLKKK